MNKMLIAIFANETAADAGRVHRSPAARRARCQAHDVQFQDVRVHPLPRQLQDGRWQTGSTPAWAGPLQHLSGRYGPDALSTFRVLLQPH